MLCFHLQLHIEQLSMHKASGSVSTFSTSEWKAIAEEMWTLSCTPELMLLLTSRASTLGKIHQAQWISTFLMLHNPWIQFLVLWWSPTIKWFPLLLHNYNFSAVVNYNINAHVFQLSWVTPGKGSLDPQRSQNMQVESHWSRGYPV